MNYGHTAHSTGKWDLTSDTSVLFNKVEIVRCAVYSVSKHATIAHRRSTKHIYEKHGSAIHAKTVRERRSYREKAALPS